MYFKLCGTNQKRFFNDGTVSSIEKYDQFFLLANRRAAQPLPHYTTSLESADQHLTELNSDIVPVILYDELDLPAGSWTIWSMWRRTSSGPWRSSRWRWRRSVCTTSSLTSGSCPGSSHIYVWLIQEIILSGFWFKVELMLSLDNQVFARQKHKIALMLADPDSVGRICIIFSDLNFHPCVPVFDLIRGPVFLV